MSAPVTLNIIKITYDNKLLQDLKLFRDVSDWAYAVFPLFMVERKVMKRASADVGFIFIAYNLRRIGNIITLNVLKEYLRMLVSCFSVIFYRSGRNISLFDELFFRTLIWIKKIIPRV
ncbi:MAG TPA: hypothetical protein DDY34_17105 [Bacteroidales bacterium]|nr:hypothetical protein [Bacteroidales bacterium]